MQKLKLCEPPGHKWLESVDIDSAGNLYFTDGVEKALYRIKREQGSNTLPSAAEQRLLSGFEHIGGVSIDRQNDQLYLGVGLKENRTYSGKILQIPLAVFEGETDLAYNPDRLGAVVEHSLEPNDRKLPSPRPNGVVFEPKTQTVFYTHEHLMGSKGYLGNTKGADVRRYITPNGLDVDPASPSTVLVFSLARKNKIVRLEFNTGQELIVDLERKKSGMFGPGPDGLICLENGDVLFAAFLAGNIYHLPWDGATYGAPREIADGLDQPTDLVIGPSSSGEGESLFVTTTKLWKVGFGRGGNLIEIPGIRTLIQPK